MTTSGVYEYRNMITAQCYIGSSINTEVRKRQHIFALRKGKHPARYMQNSWNKYGEDAFEFRVLEEVSDTSRLIEREQYWIDTKHPRFNSRTKAESNLGVKESPEATQAKRERQLGVKRPSEVVEKIKVARAKQETTEGMLRGLAIGWTLPAEQRGSRQGQTNSEEHNRKIGRANEGRKATPASIEKMRLAKLDKPLSLEHRRHIAEAGMEREVSEVTRKRISESNKVTWGKKSVEEKHRIATNRPPISEVTRTRQRESHLDKPQSAELVAKRIQASWGSKTEEEKAAIIAKRQATRAAKRNQSTETD